MNQTHNITFPVLAGILLALSLAGPAPAQQPESAVAHSEAREPTRIAPGQYCDARIDYAADIDRFEVCGEIHDVLWITVQANFDPMDPGLEVYDPSGALLASGGCGNYCSTNLAVTLPATGVYTILVADQGADEGGRYILAVNRMPPHLNPRRLPYNTAVVDRIDHGADLDWFVIRAVANAQLRLTVTANYDPMDPVVDVLDDTGAVVATGSCGNYCSFVLNFSVPITGNYFLRVRDNGLDEGGQYQLSLNVLVGQQPTQLASAWENLGQHHGIAGVCGVPTLYGTGTMAAGTPVELRLRDASPTSLFLLAAGCARLDQPLFGGTLVPTPEIVLGALTDSAGRFVLTVPSWPAGLAPGYTLYAQAWGLDPVAIDGVAAANAMVGVTP